MNELAKPVYIPGTKKGEELALTHHEPGHGTRKEYRDARMPPVKTAFVEGREVTVGDKVIIYPRNRADAMDLVLTGKTAIIEALEEEAEGRIHLAVVLEDDPGYDMGFARQSGHRFFYRSDEVKLLPIKIEQ